MDTSPSSGSSTPVACASDLDKAIQQSSRDALLAPGGCFWRPLGQRKPRHAGQGLNGFRDITDTVGEFDRRTSTPLVGGAAQRPAHLRRAGRPGLTAPFDTPHARIRMQHQNLIRLRRWRPTEVEGLIHRPGMNKNRAGCAHDSFSRVEPRRNRPRRGARVSR